MNDVLLDSIGDLQMVNGDFSIGESSFQEIQDIIMSYPGWWKEYPLLGCAAPSYLNSPKIGQQLSNTIKQQLKLDGKTVSTISSSISPNGTLTITVNGQSIKVIN